MDEKECCYNGGNKHKFVPRYSDREYATHIDNWNLPYKYDLKKVYECDVCEWCGKKA